MGNRFPKDCWHKHCEHFHVWDMSIDDLCCACDLLNAQCDACDENYSLFRCPLKGADNTLIDKVERTCGDCKYFLGCGDWDLCCSLQKRRLCYEDNKACEDFEPMKGGAEHEAD